MQQDRFRAATSDIDAAELEQELAWEAEIDQLLGSGALGGSAAQFAQPRGANLTRPVTFRCAPRVGILNQNDYVILTFGDPL